MSNLAILAILVLFALATTLFLVLVLFTSLFTSGTFFKKKNASGKLRRAHNNPILPRGNEPWEAEAVINPAAIHDGKRTHVLYRAIGTDGVSRLGYASSSDGLVFDDRPPYPVFSHKDTRPQAGMRYDPGRYGSGGSWSGVEDPRAVLIEDRVYVTYNAFNGWDSLRVALTSISLSDMQKKIWNFTPPRFLSAVGDRQKNWALFPEKINAKFALFHNLNESDDNSRVSVEYIDDLLNFDATKHHIESVDPHTVADNPCAWHFRTRSIGPPPIKTPFGWLSLYHAMDPRHPSRYKVGAILHDTSDPSLIIARSPLPVLEPEASYEVTEGVKPGIVYACGATVADDNLTVYYGAADTVACAARTSLSKFVHELQTHITPRLVPGAL